MRDGLLVSTRPFKCRNFDEGRRKFEFSRIAEKMGGGGGGISLNRRYLRNFSHFWHDSCTYIGVPKRMRLGLRVREGAGGFGLNGSVMGSGRAFRRALRKGKARMSRGKMRALGIGALLAVGAWACDEATAPPEAGSILGKVMVEGEGLDGVSVSLSNGSSQTTSGGGSYRFDGVEAGTYAVSITGYPADAAFDAATGSATIASAGQSVTVDFSGSWIRTSALTGTVMAGDMRLEGVTVRLSGMSEGSVMTDAMGAYAFSGLRAGTHTVEISGFDADLYAFAETSVTRTLAVASTEVADFAGTMLRTAGIEGVVEAEGEPLAGVAVEISGVEEHRAATDSDGMYAFADLLPGSYAVTISGYDADRVSFSEESMDVEAAANAVVKADFSGTFLRGASISGHVLADGQPVQGAVVELDGPEDAPSARTDADGMYVFSGLLPGTWTVSISGYDAESYEFAATSREVTLDPGERGTVDFQGSMLRTAAIAGAVSVEGMFVAGMAVRLTGGDMDEAMNATTDASGVYSFRGLKAGTYMAALMPTEAQMGMYAFEEMEMEVEAMDDMETRANFSGTHVRTARVSGMLVLAGGEKTLRDAGAAGLSGAVKLTLNGPGVADARTAMTDDMGMYSFGELKAGSYRLVYASPPMNPTHTKMTGGGLGTTGMVIELDAGEEMKHDFEYELTHHSLTVMAKYGYANCAKDDCMSDMGVEGVMVKAVASDPEDHAKGWGQEALAEAKTDEDGMAMLEIPTGSLAGNMVYLMGSMGDMAADFKAEDATDTAMVDPMSLKSESMDPLLYLANKANVSLTVRSVRRGSAGGGYMNKAEVAAFKGTSKTASATATTGSNGSASLTLTAAPSKTGKYRVGMKDMNLYFHHDMDDEGMEYLEFTHNGLHPPDEAMHLGTLVVGHKKVDVKVGAHRELDDVPGVSCVPLKATDKTCTGDRKDVAPSEGDVELHLEKMSDGGSWEIVSSTTMLDSSHVFKGVMTQEGKYRLRAELDSWLEEEGGMIVGSETMDLDPNSMAHMPMYAACKANPRDKKMCSSFGYKRMGNSLSAMFRSAGDPMNADGMDVELMAKALHGGKTMEENTDDMGKAVIREMLDGTYAVTATAGDSDYMFRMLQDNGTRFTGISYSETMSLGMATVGADEATGLKELMPEGMTHYETRFMDAGLEGRAAVRVTGICFNDADTLPPTADLDCSNVTRGLSGATYVDGTQTFVQGGKQVSLKVRVTGKVKAEAKETTQILSVPRGHARRTRTDDDGTFEFEGLPSEVYQVTVAGAGTQLAYPSDNETDTKNFDKAATIQEPFAGDNKRFQCKGESVLCAGGGAWGAKTDAVRQDHRTGVIMEEYAANEGPRLSGLAAPGHQALGFGMVANRKIKTKVWMYPGQDSVDSSRKKHEGMIEFPFFKCGASSRRAGNNDTTFVDCGDGFSHPRYHALTITDSAVADYGTDSVATLKRYVGGKYPMVTEGNDKILSFWLKLDGHEPVIELAPGRYVLQQENGAKSKDGKFEMKWGSNGVACDPSSGVFNEPDSTKWSRPATRRIIVPHDPTKAAWGAHQEFDPPSAYQCHALQTKGFIRISYVPLS